MGVVCPEGKEAPCPEFLEGLGKTEGLGQASASSSSRRGRGGGGS